MMEQVLFALVTLNEPKCGTTYSNAKYMLHWKLKEEVK